MAAKKNLSFSEINTAYGTTIFSFNAGVITLDLNALTGDTYTGLTDEVALEALFKMGRAYRLAQLEANDGLPLAEQLLSVNDYVYGNIENAELRVSQNIVYTMPIDGNNISGVNS